MIVRVGCVSTSLAWLRGLRVAEFHCYLIVHSPVDKQDRSSEKRSNVPIQIATAIGARTTFDTALPHLSSWRPNAKTLYILELCGYPFLHVF